MKKRTILGLAIMLAGVATLLYGVYYTLTTEYIAANISKIVATALFPSQSA